MDEGLIKVRHERSKKDFPFLQLKDGEYVEFAFSRAKISLLAAFGAVALGLIVVLLSFLVVLGTQTTLDEMGRNFLYILLMVIVTMALLICLVAWMIYRGNRLYITNKRVIQMIMKSPVATSLNMIDLPSIEDASFHQNGVLAKIFRYGTLRLATVGDETTYTFQYSNISPDELKSVSELITKAKKDAKEAKED